VKRISSRNTYFLKKIFPVIWLGFCVLSAASALNLRTPVLFPFLVLPAVMTIVGFFVMKRLVWNLVDEVYDCGDFLLVKNRGEEDRIELSNIMNVNSSTLVNPPRITLTLVNAGRFGREVAFSPQRGFTLNPFAKDQVSEDLIQRAYEARSRR
jgi:hypothetical protein